MATGQRVTAHVPGQPCHVWSGSGGSQPPATENHGERTEPQATGENSPRCTDCDAEFTEFTQLYGAALYRRLRYRFGVHHQDAEDVFQETIEALWVVFRERREIFENPGYAFRVLTNKAFDHYRRNKHRLEQITDDYKGAADDLDIHQVIRETLRDLTPMVQEVAFRTYLEGQSASLIAEELGLATGTVYNYRTIAKEALHSAMSSPATTS